MVGRILLQVEVSEITIKDFIEEFNNKGYIKVKINSCNKNLHNISLKLFKIR